MRLWFDTEFIEDGRTIDLLSIGIVRADGAMLYATSGEANKDAASDWVKANVLPSLGVVPGHRGSTSVMLNSTHREIAEAVREFAGDKPEWWAYYADYDWVSLCQLYGTMIQLPKGWPFYCRDVKQWCDALGNPKLPEQTTREHHALNDAVWTKEAWEFLRASEIQQVA